MTCICVCLGAVWVDERTGFGLYQSRGDREGLDMCLCFGCGGVGGVGGE